VTALLTVRDLVVQLGGRKRWLRPAKPPVRAVAGVSLDVMAGEILGIVGESGCGKTTLGRTIFGLQRESAGAVMLDGVRVSGLAPRAARRARRAIHYVHQDAAAALDPRWRVGRAIGEGLAIAGVGGRAARVGAVLQAVGLDRAVAGRYPHELSGGQLRRVALARILVLEPRIIVLDEPTSGLDMSVQATVLNLLLDLRQRLGLTLLFISHDLSVVERLCDRVAIMYLGRIVEVAPAAALFARPLHPYTQALLAAAPTLTPTARIAAAIQGEPPDAARLPAGCAFADRCPHVRPPCRARAQTLDDTGGAHAVACARWADIPGAD
jgi:oligopeptide/dipeptide ABC transporter ATP-binding protein